MPGATTARLVVCAFEIPMKLFMMPQTVPNRPTNGAVAPMVARTAHAVTHRARLGPGDLGKARRHALLDAALDRAVGRHPDFDGRGRPTGATAVSVARPSASCASASVRVCDPAERLRNRRRAKRKLHGLGEEDRPRHQRREGQADHHRLHQDVGGQEHRPGDRSRGAAGGHDGLRAGTVRRGRVGSTRSAVATRAAPAAASAAETPHRNAAMAASRCRSCARAGATTDSITATAVSKALRAVPVSR